MGLLFAAIGGTITALVEASIVPHLSVGGAEPHPVLLGAAILAIVIGVERGIVWAFVGGLVLDSLLGRPLGGTAFAGVAAVGAAAISAGLFPRLRVIAPVVVIPVVSVLYSVVLFGTTAALQPGGAFPDPVATSMPDALYDALIGIFVGPLAVTLHDRRTLGERAEW